VIRDGLFTNFCEIKGNKRSAKKAVNNSESCVKTIVFIVPGIISFEKIFENQDIVASKP